MRIQAHITSADWRGLRHHLDLWDVEVDQSYSSASLLQTHQQERSALFMPQAYVKHSHTNGLLVVDMQMKVDRDAVLTTLIDTDVIVVHFNLGAGHHNLRYISDVQSSSLIGAENPVDAFAVFLSKDFYFHLIDENNQLHREFVQAVRAGNDAALVPDDLPVNQEMRRIISNIRHCTRTGVLHRLCLEIKIFELLMLQLEQFQERFVSRLTKPEISGYEQEKLEAAKAVLEERYDDPPTIRQLSLMVGLNELKLKSGFKKAFNSTIHTYTVKLRMERAVELMKEQQLLIREIALEVGYQNPSHFSAAFKEYYGYGPSEYRTAGGG